MKTRTAILLLIAILAGATAAFATYRLVAQHPAANRLDANDGSDPGLIP